MKYSTMQTLQLRVTTPANHLRLCREALKAVGWSRSMEFQIRSRGMDKANGRGVLSSLFGIAEPVDISMILI